MFSSLQRCGKYRTDAIALQIRKNRMEKAIKMLNLCIRIAEFRLKHGRYFYFEHPFGASSWETPLMQKLLRHSQVELSKIDMCAYGLVSPRNVPMKKSTGILHNIPALSPMLVLRCDGSHKHDRIEGSISGCKCSLWAQKYPKFFCQALAGGIQQQIHWDQGIQFQEAHQVSEYGQFPF